MRLPNAPPGLLHHPVPGLRGTASLNANRHAVCYFTALLCGIPLSRYPGLSRVFDSVQEANYWGPQIRCEIEGSVRVKYREFREAVFRDQISGADAAAQMQELCTKEYKAAGFA